MFNRNVLPAAFGSQRELTAALVSIGMSFAATRAKDEPNIEDALFAASTAAFEGDDYRLLAVTTMWLEVHSDIVIVDRITRLADLLPPERHRAYWVSVARWLGKKDARFRRLAKMWPDTFERVELVPDSAFQLERHGEDERFAGGPLVVHAKVLRRRRDDVAEPAFVAKSHRGYRFRLAFGARYSADMWAHISLRPSSTAAELARLAHGSYATAHEVALKHALLGGIESLARD